MSALDWLSVLLATGGLLFFTAGTIGLLRLPDAYCRLHALTKVDNAGLGLIVAALVLRADSPWLAGRLLLTWLLAIFASAVSAQLIARTALERERAPR